VNTAPLRKLVIVGVGLIGGSFARALRDLNLAPRVVGVGRSPANLELARQLGLIDEIAADYALALQDAELVLVAAPVAQFAGVFETMAPHLHEDTIVTDAGSTKQDVIAAARANFGTRVARFVPAHPIAGTEHSGAGAARGDLYRDRNVVLTPLPETDTAAVQRVEALWRACGAQVHRMSAERHDRIFAAVSHLPHVLAFTLVGELAARSDAGEFFRYAAGGFRDFTRIASSSPEMWRDICLANRDAIATELSAYRAQLDRVAALLAARDGDGIAALFETARSARNAWLTRQDKDAE
jgi:prephenate dehydrogenase